MRVVRQRTKENGDLQEHFGSKFAAMVRQRREVLEIGDLLKEYVVAWTAFSGG